MSGGIQKAKSIFSRFLHTGIDASTPAHLIDRIVYSNWICAIGTFINIMGAQANYAEGNRFLLNWNGVYQLAIIACWALNRRKLYLAGRVLLNSITVLGISTSSAAVGRGIQMEHFLLATSALSFTLFHPSERRWAWLFGSISIVAFLYIAYQPGPVLNVISPPWQYRVEDLRANQSMYALLIISSLIALSNAYARATKLADEQRAKLFESNKMVALGQMASGIGHEVNTPISVIHALTEMMSRKLKTPELNREELIQALEKIQATTRRVGQIVDGLRGFSRSADNLPFVLTPMNQIVDDTLTLCQERVLSIGVALTVIKAQEGGAAECRAVQISQALLNLLNNACDAIASHKEKWIKISIHENASQVAIHVQNSGSKIPREIREKLFQPFFTTKEVGRGTGLGLAVSLAMLKEHGGSIHLDADAPNTTFIMTLPKQRLRQT